MLLKVFRLEHFTKKVSKHGRHNRIPCVNTCQQKNTFFNWKLQPSNLEALLVAMFGNLCPKKIVHPWKKHGTEKISHLMVPCPDAQCMVYLPTCTPQNCPNVGKKAIRRASGRLVRHSVTPRYIMSTISKNVLNLPRGRLAGYLHGTLTRAAAFAVHPASRNGPHLIICPLKNPDLMQGGNPKYHNSSLLPGAESVWSWGA